MGGEGEGGVREGLRGVYERSGRGLGGVWEGRGRGGLDLGEDKNGSAVYFPTPRHDAVAWNMRCVHSKVCAPVRLEHVVLSEALHRVGVDWKRRSRGGDSRKRRSRGCLSDTLHIRIRR